MSQFLKISFTDTPAKSINHTDAPLNIFVTPPPPSNFNKHIQPQTSPIPNHPQEQLSDSTNILAYQRSRNFDLSLKIEMMAEDLAKSEETNHTLRTLVIELESQVSLLKNRLANQEKTNDERRLEIQELGKQVERTRENEKTERRLMEIEVESYRNKIVDLEFEVEKYVKKIEEVENDKMKLRVEMKMQEEAIESNEKEIIANGVLIERLKEEVEEIKKMSTESKNQKLMRVKSSDNLRVIDPLTARRRIQTLNERQLVGKIVQKVNGHSYETRRHRQQASNQRDLRIFYELIQRTKKMEGEIGKSCLERIERIEKEMNFIR